MKKKIHTAHRDGTRTRSAKARSKAYRDARRVKYALAVDSAVTPQEVAR